LASPTRQFLTCHEFLSCRINQRCAQFSAMMMTPDHKLAPGQGIRFIARDWQ
jgi:hypothetical protein